MASSRAAAALLLCMLLSASTVHNAAAQDAVAQTAALQKIADYLSKSIPPIGWNRNPSANPCTDFPGVTCAADGSVTEINLSGQPLTGSLPGETAVWTNLPGLVTLDLSNTGIGGDIPATLALARSLTNINLGGNSLTGPIPAQLRDPRFNLVVAPGNVGLEATPPASTPVASPPAESPAPTPADNPVDSPAPATPAASPAPVVDPATPTTPPTPSPASPAVVAPPASPSPPPVAISSAQVCSCALRGFASSDCQAAFTAQCAGSTPPPSAACSGYANAARDVAAASAVAQYVQAQCFAGQDLASSPCVCTSNFGSNDCAKARVALCASSDVLCLPFQNIADGSSASQVAAYLRQQCPIPQPTRPGVQVAISFASVDLNTYISQQYTQGVANALSSVSNVPSSAVQVLDVRPLGPSRRRRALLQASAGVQATYFVVSDTPEALSATLQRAAGDNSLRQALNNNGIEGSPLVTLQTFTAPTAPVPSSGPASDGGSSFPAWAIAVIVVVVVLVLGVVGSVLWCRFCGGRCGRKASRGAPLADDFEPSPYKAVSYPEPPRKAELQMAPAPLPVTRSVRTTPANAPYLAPMTASGTGMVPPAAAAAAASAPVLTPWSGATPAPVRTHVPVSPAASTPSATGAPAAGGFAQPGAPVSVATSDGTEWRTNVRSTASETSSATTATTAPAAAAGSSMAANPARTLQQAERAKFWAQFQETWQQVRQTKKVKEDEPGTPSSGTNWTETDAGSDHGRGRLSEAGSRP